MRLPGSSAFPAPGRAGAAPGCAGGGGLRLCLCSHSRRCRDPGRSGVWCLQLLQVWRCSKLGRLPALGFGGRRAPSSPGAAGGAPRARGARVPHRLLRVSAAGEAGTAPPAAPRSSALFCSRVGFKKARKHVCKSFKCRQVWSPGKFPTNICGV